jgi:signal transduction histidine kinase
VRVSGGAPTSEAVRGQDGRPAWERRAIPLAVAVTWLLAAAIDVRPGTCGCNLGITWEWRALLLLAIGAVWLLELRGFCLPRPLFALAVAVPAALLNVAKDGAIAILFPLLAVAWVADRGTRRESLWALGIAVLASFSYAGDGDVEGLLSVAGASVSIWLVMRGLRRERLLVSELRAAQVDLARQAALAERRRIAGEIHDVAAHSLAVTMLHLTGARLLLQRLRADGRAIEALSAAERAGRQSLDDLRRSVGLLDGPAGTAAPLPGAADLPALVDEFRAAGMDVRLTLEGDTAALPPAVGLALYRIAHEALANAARHAPGATVDVGVAAGPTVRLRVADGGAAPGRALAPTPGSGGKAGTSGTGHGIPGMRQRAALLGGTLSAGREGAGWVVTCALPGVAGSPVADAARRPEADAAAGPPAPVGAQG